MALITLTRIKENKSSVKRILEQIIDKHTKGNYLLSSSDKEQMVSEILNQWQLLLSYEKLKQGAREMGLFRRLK